MQLIHKGKEDYIKSVVKLDEKMERFVKEHCNNEQHPLYMAYLTIHKIRTNNIKKG